MKKNVYLLENGLLSLDKSLSNRGLSKGESEKAELQLQTFDIKTEELKESVYTVLRVSSGLALEKKILKGIKTIFDKKFYNVKVLLNQMKVKIGKIKDKQKSRKIFLTKPSRGRIRFEDEGVIDRRRNMNQKEADGLDNDNEELQGLNLVTNEAELVNEQNNRLKDINKSLDHMVDGFKKVTEMVALHDEIFSDIEMSTMEARTEIKKGRGVLTKIHKDISNNRKFILQFFGILFLVGILYLYFL